MVDDPAHRVYRHDRALEPEWNRLRATTAPMDPERLLAPISDGRPIEQVFEVADAHDGVMIQRVKPALEVLQLKHHP